MEEGRLVKWTKHEGDPVKSGDTLAEVETDKAVMELVARADGQLLKVMVPEGTTVPVGNIVAWIGKPGEKVDGDGARRRHRKVRLQRQPRSPKPTQLRHCASLASHVTTRSVRRCGRVKASPLAKRIAKEAGVDLQLVQGSGPGGRVIKRDVEGTPATPAALTAPPTYTHHAPPCHTRTSRSPRSERPLRSV